MTEIETYGARGSMLEPVTDSWVSTMGDVVKLASYICHTEFVPAALRERPGTENAGAKAAAAMLTGRELGLPPMTSLASIHVINGKPGISAELMRAMVAQRGHEIRFGKVSSSEVTVRGRRAEDRDDDGAWTEVTWTIGEAQRAGLVSNGNNYAKYPRQMLTARATTELCRLLFADVIHGLRSVEELEALGTDGEVTVEYREEPAAPPARQPRQARVQPIDAAPAPEEATPPTSSATAARPTTATRTSRRSPSLTRRGATNDAAAPEGSGQGHPTAGVGPDAAASQALEDEATPRDTPASPAGTGEPSPSASTPAPPAGAEEASPKGGGATDRESTAPSPEPVADEDGAVPVEIVEDDAPPREPGITPDQTTKLVVSFQKLAVTDRSERQYMTGVLAGREVESAKDLTKAEASRVIDALEQCGTNEDLQAVVNATADHAEKADR